VLEESEESLEPVESEEPEEEVESVELELELELDPEAAVVTGVAIALLSNELLMVPIQTFPENLSSDSGGSFSEAGGRASEDPPAGLG
jgi:hypothetical protein